MYEDLVKSLRTDHDKYFARDMEAADAIEKLKKKLYFQDITTAQILAMYMPLFIPKWIPVTERLPNPKDLVLVCNEFGGVHYGYFESNNQWYTANNWLVDAWTVMPNVTHWMPLPEPPKEE